MLRRHSDYSELSAETSCVPLSGNPLGTEPVVDQRPGKCAACTKTCHQILKYIKYIGTYPLDQSIREYGLDLALGYLLTSGVDATTIIYLYI